MREFQTAWDAQEIPDCQSQELGLLSGLRDIFLVGVIRERLHPERAKPKPEAHSHQRRSEVSSGQEGGIAQAQGSHTPPAPAACARSPSWIPPRGCCWGWPGRLEDPPTSLRGPPPHCFPCPARELPGAGGDASLPAGHGGRRSKESRPSRALLWGGGRGGPCERLPAEASAARAPPRLDPPRPPPTPAASASHPDRSTSVPGA